MTWQSLNDPNKLGGIDKEKAMTLYSQRAIKRAQAYCDKMNAIHGYPLYAVPDVFAIPLKFGLGTFGLPLLILSFFPIVIPFILWDAGLLPIQFFNWQISFGPAQIAAIGAHLLIAFACGLICKKYSWAHYGAARGADVFSFILVDVYLRILMIPVAVGFMLVPIWFLFRT